jgi:hypothetical protein
VLVCPETKILLAGCWWLVCCERKVLLARGSNEQAQACMVQHTILTMKN